MSDKTENKMLPSAINEDQALKILDENEALKILESFAAKNEIVVPLIVSDQLLHEGIKFDLPLERYNKFLNDSQNGKQSMTATAKNFLVDIVAEEHRPFLVKALKVKGMLNFFMDKVTSQAQPQFGETLD